MYLNEATNYLGTVFTISCSTVILIYSMLYKHKFQRALLLLLVKCPPHPPSQLLPYVEVLGFTSKSSVLPMCFCSKYLVMLLKEVT